MSSQWSLVTIFLILLISIIACVSPGFATGYTVWTADAMTKVSRTALPDKPRQNVEIYAARNEYESAQVVIRAMSTPLKQVQVTISDLTGPAGAKIKARDIGLYRVGYVTLPAYNRDQADPLPPLMRFDVPSDSNQPVWITVYVPKRQPAGEYTGEITIRPANPDATVRYLPVKLTVWNFTLPEKPTTRSAFGLDYSSVMTAHGNPEPAAARELRKRYYEMMVQHRLSPYEPPVPVNDPDIGRYLGDKRVTGFVVSYSEDTTVLKATVERLRKGGWLSKGYFYVVDEPGRQDQYDELKRTTAKIRSIDPTLKVVTPTDRNPECLPGTSFWDGLAGITTIWCPILPLHDEAQAQKKQAKGEEVWWYVCCSPGPPFPNFFTNYDGIDHRVLMWMQKLYGVQGLLYWNATYWQSSKDVWDDPATVKWISSEIYGDGSLLYPGSKVGYDGPVSSIRLECIRDGMEDFEYLSLLEKKIGPDKMKEMIRRVTTSKTEYVKDPLVLQRVRNEIARILSEK